MYRCDLVRVLVSMEAGKNMGGAKINWTFEGRNRVG